MLSATWPSVSLGPQKDGSPFFPFFLRNESITTLDFPSYSLEKAGVYYFALSTVPEQRLALGQVVDIVDDRMIAISPSFRVDGPPELGVVEVNPPAGEAAAA